MERKKYTAEFKREAVKLARQHGGSRAKVAQELGSWESVEMVRRYAHLSADHLASYVDRVSGLRPVGAGEVATLRLQSPEMQTAS